MEYALLESSGFDVIFACQLCDILIFHSESVIFVTLLCSISLTALSDRENPKEVNM
jgi:hypothetical protein